MVAMSIKAKITGQNNRWMLFRNPSQGYHLVERCAWKMPKLTLEGDMMGISAVAKIYDDGGEKVFVILYKPVGGHPHDFGNDLVEFTRKFKFRPTSVTMLEDLHKDYVANGMHCYAASLFKHFKHGAGGVYLYPTEYPPLYEDYWYHIKPDGNSIAVTWEGYPNFRRYNEY